MFSPRLDGGYFVQFFQISKKSFSQCAKLRTKLPILGAAAAFGSVRKLRKFSYLIKQD